MTETPPEAATLPEPEAPEAPQRPEATPADDGLYDAPADAADDTASGYAVYDRVLGRFVGGKSAEKPKAADAKAAAAGHTYKVVRV